MGSVVYFLAYVEGPNSILTENQQNHNPFTGRRRQRGRGFSFSPVRARFCLFALSPLALFWLLFAPNLLRDERRGAAFLFLKRRQRRGACGSSGLGFIGHRGNVLAKGRESVRDPATGYWCRLRNAELSVLGRLSMLGGEQ